MDLTEFNEIRPYNDEELPQIFEELIADPAFQKAVTGVIPNVPFELLAQKMRACKTKREFQEAFCYGILWKIAQEHTDSLTLDHSRIPDHNIAYTYMSNHRDIILDSGFLSILLIDEGMDTVEIGGSDVYPALEALIDGNIDMVLADMKMLVEMEKSGQQLEDGIVISGVLKRRDPRYVMIRRKGTKDIVENAVVATDSDENAAVISGISFILLPAL
jgi:hypothetical protein